DAGSGADSANTQFAAIANAQVTGHFAMGDGADACTTVLFSGASGNSTVNLAVAGQTGADRVDDNLMGKIDAAANVTVRADNTTTANDRLVVRYKGELDGKLNVNVDKAATLYGVQALF